MDVWSGWESHSPLGNLTIPEWGGKKQLEIPYPCLLSKHWQDVPHVRCSGCMWKACPCVDMGVICFDLKWRYNDSSKLRQETEHFSIWARGINFVIMFGGINRPLILHQDVTPLNVISLYAAKVHICMDPLPDSMNHICFVWGLWKIKGWFYVASNLLVPTHVCVPFQHYVNLNTVQCRGHEYYTIITKAYLLYLHVTKGFSVVIFCTYTELLIIMHCFTINPLGPHVVYKHLQIFKYCQNTWYMIFGQLLTTQLFFLI